MLIRKHRYDVSLFQVIRIFSKSDSSIDFIANVVFKKIYIWIGKVRGCVRQGVFIYHVIKAQLILQILKRIKNDLQEPLTIVMQYFV